MPAVGAGKGGRVEAGAGERLYFFPRLLFFLFFFSVSIKTAILSRAMKPGQPSNPQNSTPSHYKISIHGDVIIS